MNKSYKKEPNGKDITKNIIIKNTIKQLTGWSQQQTGDDRGESVNLRNKQNLFNLNRENILKKNIQRLMNLSDIKTTTKICVICFGGKKKAWT